MYPYSAAGAWSTAPTRDVEKVAARYRQTLEAESEARGYGRDSKELKNALAILAGAVPGAAWRVHGAELEKM